MTEELRRVGAQMANALYNLSQSMDLAEHARQTAKRLSAEWDEAMRSPPPTHNMRGALAAVADERLRQVAKGYDTAHDDEHKGGEIVLADWGARARIEAAINAGRAGDSPAYKELLTEAAAQCVAEIDIARKVVEAWEALPGGRNYSMKVVESWLTVHMAPMVNEMRSLMRDHDHA